MSDISTDMLELLAYMLEEDNAEIQPQQTSIPRVETGQAPLSFAQERLWFLDQVTPGNPAYNIPAAVRCTGTLNIDALHRTLNEIVRRHAALRTTFALSSGAPVQVITPELQVELPVIDLTALPVAEQAAEVQRQIVAHANYAFDLARGPVLQARLLQLSATEAIFLLCMHHIVSDGWSNGVLMHEISALYTAFVRGQTSPLPELPIQYADFAVWQRSQLQGQLYDELLSYWKQQLKDVPALDLPLDGPRPTKQSFGGATHHHLFAPALNEPLQTLQVETSATLFMVLLATFDVLLHYLTRADDIVVGTDVANRTLPETEGLIGFFVNQLALRTHLSGNPTFRQIVAQVRETTLAAYTHQDLPFNTLVDALKLKRDLSRAPLFQVKLILQNAPRPALELPDLSMEIFKLDSVNAVFDLSLFVVQSEQQLSAAFRYSTDLFKPSTIARMSAQLETLLAKIVAEPDTHLDALYQLLADDDQQQQQAQAQQLDQTMLRQLKTTRRKAFGSTQ